MAVVVIETDVNAAGLNTNTARWRYPYTGANTTGALYGDGAALRSDTLDGAGQVGGVGNAVVGNAIMEIALSDLPADFVTADSATIQARLQVANLTNDTFFIQVSVRDSSGVGITNPATLHNNLGNMADTTTGEIGLTGPLTTASKATWDSAHFYITWSRTVSMGADADGIAVIEWIKLRLTYLPIPTAPLSTSAVAHPTTDGAIRVSWQPPSNAESITQYRLRWRTTGGAFFTDSATPTGLTHDVTGLTQGQEYEFQVAAENASGIGAYSASFFGFPKTSGGGGGSPQTWTGSTASAGVAGQSGSFVPGAVTWAGSTASIGVAGQSGTWSTSGGAQTWTGSTATIGVAGQSGSFSDPDWGRATGAAITQLTAVAPPGVTTGDPLLAHVVHTSSSATVTPPTGWSLVPKQGGGFAETNAVDFTSYLYKLDSPWTGSEAMTFGFSTSVNASIDVYRHPGYVIDNANEIHTTVAANAVTVGVAPVANGCDVMTFAACDATGGARTWTSDVGTELLDRSDNDLHRQVTRRTISGGAGVTQSTTATISGTVQDLAAIAVSLAVAVSGDTWTGSTGSLGVAGQSGAFVPGEVTWAGSTATVGAAGQSGAFAPGAATWSGSTATAGVAGQSGSFTPGTVTWAGSTATIGAAGQSGSFVPGVATWSGSTATVGVAGQSGAFVPGATTWAGSTGTAGVAGQSGSFVPGAVTWAGSVASIGVAGQSGSWSAEGGPQTWTGSVASIGVAAQSGNFTPGTVVWSGSTATVSVTAQTGSFASGFVWGGSAATAGVAGQSGNFTPGAVTWTGSTATAGVAGQSGAFTPGTVTWAGSTATAGVAGQSGAFVPGATTWAGSIATIGVAGVTGIWSAEGGPQTWPGSVAIIGVAGQSGSFVPGARTWAGSIATVGAAGQSGAFVPGTATWAGSAASIGVAAQSGAWSSGAPPLTWAGSTASIGVATASGAFVPGAATWQGSTAAVGVFGASGAFGSAVTWLGSESSIGLAGQSGLFLPGLVTWAGTSGLIAVDARSGVWFISADLPLHFAGWYNGKGVVEMFWNGGAVMDYYLVPA
jgi:hypothetical protein